MNHDYIELNHIVDRYLLDKLPPEETDQFEQHYLHCTRCQDELELSEKFRIGLEQSAAGPRTESAKSDRQTLWSNYRKLVGQPAFAVAATGLIAAVLSANVISLYLLRDARISESKIATELTDALSPQANTPIVVLSPARSSRTSAESAHRITLGDKPAWIVLAMELPDVSLPRYRAALRDDKAETMWRTDDLLLNNNDEIVVTVHSSQLATGDFYLQVDGLKSDDSWATIGNYVFKVSSQ